MGKLSTPNSPSQSDLLPEDWAKKLFRMLATMYGSHWLDMWQGIPMAEVQADWRHYLAGYGGDEIARGLNACKLRGWGKPPTLPEFAKLCRPPLDYEAAFIEAVEQMRKRETGEDKWTSPAIYWAAVRFGSFELRQASYQACAKRWGRLLDDMLAKGDALEAVPPRREALPAPGQTTLTREQARERIAQIRARLGQGALAGLTK